MKNLTWLACVLILGTLVAGCSNGKFIAQKDQQISDMQSQINALKGEVREEQERSEALNAELETALGDLQKKEQVWLEEKEGLTHITLDGEVTFASGSSRLTSSGKEILDKIWKVLANYPEKEVLIEGHTDNVPIAPQFQSTFKSNWELSSARAHRVLHYVRDKYGIDPKRIGAVGYGEYRPIADNATESGRALNRRVVITVGGKLKQSQMVP